MKTRYFLMILAVAAFVGCATKESKPASQEESVVSDTAYSDEVVASTIPTEEQIIMAEADEPDMEEAPKRDIGSLKTFISTDGGTEAYLVGKIDNKYAVHMSLWWYVGHNAEFDEEGNTIDMAYLFTLYGAYYYDSNKNGLNNYLELSEDLVDKNHIVLSEYNKNGDITGTFDGRVKGNTYEGQFIRAKDGKRMPFKLTYVNDENDGSFVVPSM